MINKNKNTILIVIIIILLLGLLGLTYYTFFIRKEGKIKDNNQIRDKNDNIYNNVVVEEIDVEKLENIIIDIYEEKKALEMVKGFDEIEITDKVKELTIAEELSIIKTKRPEIFNKITSEISYFDETIESSMYENYKKLYVNKKDTNGIKYKFYADDAEKLICNEKNSNPYTKGQIRLIFMSLGFTVDEIEKIDFNAYKCWYNGGGGGERNYGVASKVEIKKEIIRLFGTDNDIFKESFHIGAFTYDKNIDKLIYHYPSGWVASVPVTQVLNNEIKNDSQEIIFTNYILNKTDNMNGWKLNNELFNKIIIINKKEFDEAENYIKKYVYKNQAEFNKYKLTFKNGVFQKLEKI